MQHWNSSVWLYLFMNTPYPLQSLMVRMEGSKFNVDATIFTHLEHLSCICQLKKGTIMPLISFKKNKSHSVFTVIS
jgi:hypothetical protein